MIKSFIKQLAGKRACRLFLITGIILSCLAVYKLLRTAMYIQECVVVSATVTDVIQKPFETTGDALKNGNLALGGATSYQAIVRYTLPNGLIINRQMTDADDTDYTIGQQVEVITPEVDPSKAHINKWKFIWGWECMQLGAGAVLLLLGCILSERKKSSDTTAKSGKTTRNNKKKTQGNKPAKRNTRKNKQS